MTLSAAEIASVLLVPLVLGAGILRALGIAWRTDRLAWLGWAWSAGALGVGALLFVCLVLGLPLDARWLAPAAAGAGVALALVFRRRPEAWAGVPAETPREDEPLPHVPRPAEPSRPERWLFGAVLAVLVATTAASAVRDAWTPLVRGDETHLYASRAKVMWHAGRFGETFREHTVVRPYVQHPDYPPLNPLLQLWTFAHAGGILHVENRLPVQAFSVALLLVLAAALRRRVRPALAAALLVLVHGQPWARELARFAFADGMVATGVLIAVDAWLSRDERPSRAWPWLAGLGLGLAVWSKNEGLLFLAALGGAALLAELVRARPNPVPRRPAVLPARASWSALWIPLVLAAAQLGFNRAFGFENDIVGRERSELGLAARLLGNLGERLGEVLRYHAAEVWLAPEAGRLVVVLFLGLALVFPLRLLRGPLLAPALGALVVLAGYVLVFVASPAADLRWHLDTAAARVTWHLVPALALCLGVALARLAPRLGVPR